MPKRWPSVDRLTEAGQMLVMAISFLPCLTKSMAKPLVKTLMATFPIA
jgi:hypothetical protein